MASAVVISFAVHGAHAEAGQGSGVAAFRSPLRPPRPIEIVALPARPVVGQLVRLVVLDPLAAASDYRWDLTDQGTDSIDTGANARTTTKFSAPGMHRVAVLVTVGSVTRVGVRAVNVRRGGPDNLTRVHAASHRAPPETSRRPARATKLRTPAREGTPHAMRPLRIAHLARTVGDPGVTIADFDFTPPTITIHAGDTVTWTNSGPSSHTATARGGSFDTGVLSKGASGSHTFTQAGSFSYFCKIHPFMHGTIVVLGAAKSAAPTSVSSAHSSTPKPGSTSAPAQPVGGSSPAPAAAKPDASGTTLPMTGVNVLAGLSAGLLLLALGLALRRAALR